MLRDIACALALAAIMGALYAVGMSLSPVSFQFGTATGDIVVLVGAMFTALGFLTGLLCSRFDGRLDDRMADVEDRNRQIDEQAVAMARRLNTHPHAANAGRDVRAEVIPFPRLRASRYLDQPLAGGQTVN